MQPWGHVFSDKKHTDTHTHTGSKREGTDMTSSWELEEEKVHTFSKCVFLFSKRQKWSQVIRQRGNLQTQGLDSLFVVCIGFFGVFFLLFIQVLNIDCWCRQQNRNTRCFLRNFNPLQYYLQTWVCRASWQHISGPSCLLSLARLS